MKNGSALLGRRVSLEDLYMMSHFYLCSLLTQSWFVGVEVMGKKFLRLVVLLV